MENEEKIARRALCLEYSSVIEAWQACLSKRWLTALA
jgi:hypothetical protein